MGLISFAGDILGGGWSALKGTAQSAVWKEYFESGDMSALQNEEFYEEAATLLNATEKTNEIKKYLITETVSTMVGGDAAAVEEIMSSYDDSAVTTPEAQKQEIQAWIEITTAETEEEAIAALKNIPTLDENVIDNILKNLGGNQYLTNPYSMDTIDTLNIEKTKLTLLQMKQKRLLRLKLKVEVMKMFDYSYTSLTTNFKFKFRDSEYQVETNLLNKFNIYNYLTALIFVNMLGIEIDDIIKISKDIYAPNGRNEIIKVGNSKAIIDYMSGMTDQYIVRTYNEIISF